MFQGLWKVCLSLGADCAAVKVRLPFRGVIRAKMRPLSWPVSGQIFVETPVISLESPLLVMSDMMAFNPAGMRVRKKRQDFQVNRQEFLPKQPV